MLQGGVRAVRGLKWAVNGSFAIAVRFGCTWVLPQMAVAKRSVSLWQGGAMPHSLVALGFVAAGKVRGEADADRPFPFTEGVFPR